MPPQEPPIDTPEPETGDMTLTRRRVGGGRNYSHLEFKTAADFPDRKVVGVDGLWYDVTHFTEKHPGGPIIDHFVGQDATHVFHAYGHKGVLEQRIPIARYEQRVMHPADKEFGEMIKQFIEWGWFETNWMFYVKKISFCFSLFIFAWCMVLFTDHWALHYLGAVSLAFHWQQCGFIMHDFMHSQVFKNRHIDEIFGMLFGTTQFGISAHWWKDEHIIHHAVTNVVDLKKNFYDPQMWEQLWAQNAKAFPLFTTYTQYLFIKIQHITFVPVVILIGRFDIVFDSFIGQREPRLREWLFWIPHWIWVVGILYCLPNWQERICFYYIAAAIEGLFHFQLILSHYCRDHLHNDEFHESSWYKYQTESNMNIECAPIFDWYYGGLNYHIEHHIMPTLPRFRLRSAGKYVKDICDRHGIEYLMVPFSTALVLTLKHLKATGKMFSLDPR